MGFKLMNGVHEAWINEVMETHGQRSGYLTGLVRSFFFWSSFVVTWKSGKQQALKGLIGCIGGVWICCVYSLLIPLASFHLDKSTSLFLMSN